MKAILFVGFVAATMVLPLRHANAPEWAGWLAGVLGLHLGVLVWNVYQLHRTLLERLPPPARASDAARWSPPPP